MIRAENVSYSYSGNAQTVTGLSFRIEKGEFAAILGENGAGKTTTVKLIDGLLKPTEGKMTVNGLDTAKSRVRWASSSRIRTARSAAAPSGKR